MRGSVAVGCAAAAFVGGLAAAQSTAPPPDPRTVRLDGGRFAPLTYYQMASMLLNVDQYPLPAGVKPEMTPVP